MAFARTHPAPVMLVAMRSAPLAASNLAMKPSHWVSMWTTTAPPLKRIDGDVEAPTTHNSTEPPLLPEPAVGIAVTAYSTSSAESPMDWCHTKSPSSASNRASKMSRCPRFDSLPRTLSLPRLGRMTETVLDRYSHCATHQSQQWVCECTQAATVAGGSGVAPTPTTTPAPRL